MQNLTIKSITKNRIRFKSLAFRSIAENEFYELIKRGAQIRHNLKCHSIIVVYDDKNLPTEEIIDFFKSKFVKEIYENTQSNISRSAKANLTIPDVFMSKFSMRSPIKRAIKAIFDNKLLLIIVIILIFIFFFKLKKFSNLFKFIKKLQKLRANMVEFKKIEKMVIEHMFEALLQNLRNDHYHISDDNDYYKFISHHEE